MTTEINDVLIWNNNLIHTVYYNNSLNPITKNYSNPFMPGGRSPGFNKVVIGIGSDFHDRSLVGYNRSMINHNRLCTLSSQQHLLAISATN